MIYFFIIPLIVLKKEIDYHSHYQTIRWSLLGHSVDHRDGHTSGHDPHHYPSHFAISSKPLS